MDFQKNDIFWKNNAPPTPHNTPHDQGLQAKKNDTSGGEGCYLDWG